MFRLEIEPAETLHTKFGNAKININGYYHITSGKEGNNMKYLHRLIFEDFYGRIPEGCHIHHKDENKLNNCILNLQLLTERQHNSLHKPSEETKQKMSEAHKGENHHMYGKHHSDETKQKMSKAHNSSGYYRVYKEKNSLCKQGFRWSYKYYDDDGKQKAISSVSLEKLEEKVRAKNFPWYKIQGGINL